MRLNYADLTGPHQPAGDGQLNYKFCPVCGNTGWHFYVGRTGGWDCKKCGVAGYMTDAPPRIPQPDEEPKWAPVEVPGMRRWSPTCYQYLEQRGVVPQEIWVRYGIQDWPERKRLVIPYFNDQGQPIYWVARSYADEKPKYLKPQGKQPLYVANWHNDSDALVVVEGVFDAWAVANLGFAAAALVAKTLPRHLHHMLRRLMHGRAKVVVALDGDALQDGMKLADTLRRWHDHVTVALLPDGKDPAEMEPGELRELLT